MREVLAILNDRITVNIINGKTEAVAALRELREAIHEPLSRTTQKAFASASILESLEEAWSGWDGYQESQAKRLIESMRRSLIE